MPRDTEASTLGAKSDSGKLPFNIPLLSAPKSIIMQQGKREASNTLFGFVTKVPGL